MQWIQEHLQLILIVASAFAWWLTQRKQRSAEDESPPHPLPDEPVAPFDEAERTRRIQEEIRRKIAQRHAPSGAPEAPAERPMPQPPPLIPREAARPVPPPLVLTPKRETAEWTEADQNLLERQRRLQEQLRSLEEQRRAARAQASTFPPATASTASGRAVAGAHRGLPVDWRAALRDRASLRQAVVLREVLSPPVALR